MRCAYRNRNNPDNRNNNNGFRLVQYSLMSELDHSRMIGAHIEESRFFSCLARSQPATRQNKSADTAGNLTVNAVPAHHFPTSGKRLQISPETRSKRPGLSSHSLN